MQKVFRIAGVASIANFFMASILLVPFTAFAQEQEDGPPGIDSQDPPALDAQETPTPDSQDLGEPPPGIDSQAPTSFESQLRGDMEEITVTARKREEKLQDVPISITAFSSKGLSDRNIQDAYDLANFTPNFQLTTNLGRRLDNPIIRGQFGPLIGSTPNASFFVDGVFVSGSIGTTNVANLERIEILRGPQSASFGRATFAGAVNYITRKPTDEYEGELNTKYGEHGRLDLGAWASGPIIKDKLYFFAGASQNKWDGEWRNGLKEYDTQAFYSDTGYVIPGRPDISGVPYGQQAGFPGLAAWASNPSVAGDPPCLFVGPGCAPTVGDNTELGGTETQTYTLKLTWEATDWLQFNAKYERAQADDDHIVYKLVAPGSNNHCYNRLAGGTNATTGAGAVVDTKRLTGDDPTAPGATGVRTTGAICGALNDNGYVPKLNIPNMRRGVTIGFPPPGTRSARPAPFLGQEETVKRLFVDSIADIGDYELTVRYAHNQRDSEYVRDLDRSYGLGPVTVGLFEANTWDDSSDDSTEIRLASPGDKRLRWLLGAYLYHYDLDQFQRNFTGFGDANTRNGTGSEEIKNTAVFGSIELDLNDDWTLAFEGRYAKDEINRTTSPFDRALTSPDVPTCDYIDRGVPGVGTERLDCNNNFYSWSPRTTLTWNIKDDGSMTGYAQVAEGNKPGGYNFAYFDGDADFTAVDFDNDVVIKEETATTYELGLKGTYFDNTLSANLAVFYIDWDDQAINARECIPQLDDPGPPPTPTPCQDNNIVRNAGESSVKGLELEMNWFPTDRQSYTLGYGYTDSELDDYVDKEFAVLQCPAECFIFEPGDIELTDSSMALIDELGKVDGNKAPRTPKHNLSLSQVYQAPFVDTGYEWFVRNDVLYESKKYVNPSNLNYAPEQWTWNGRIGLESPNWTVSLYVDNITDEKSPLAIQTFPLFDFSQGYEGYPLPAPTGAPVQQDSYQILPRRERNVGVTFSAQFGAR